MRIDRDDIVLAVGVSGDSPGLVQLIETAARAGASAVVLKGLEEYEWARAVADRAGVAVLVAPRDLAWEHLYAQVRAAVATGHVLRGDHEGTVSTGDLFALADAAAADLGGEVEIDDASMHVRAFSTRGGEIDELRRVSILRRCPPPSFMQWLRDSGSLGRIRESLRPVRLDPRFSGVGPDPWGGTRASATATTQLRREDFAMNFNQALQTGIAAIGTTLKVEIDVQAVRED